MKTRKPGVNPSEVGTEVHKMKKIKNGELLITIRNGAYKADVFKNELNESADMDEIRETIARTLNIPQER